MNAVMKEAAQDIQAFVKGLETPYLQQVYSAIPAELARRKEESVRSAIAQCQGILGKIGLTIEDIAHKKNNRAPMPSAKIKYKHPTDPKKHWTGRGKQPLWLAMDAPNGDIEAFRVRT